ncbi:hypothetical protein ACFL1B_01490 [Nanoarchaeota archaeon]
MGLLNHFFSSNESIAEEIEQDDEAIHDKWRKYSETIPRKKDIIESLQIGEQIQDKLKELNSILSLELVSVHKEEIEELELLRDLDTLEHSQKIKRVHRLEHCLDYVETRHEYVYQLLHQLYSRIKSQIHLTEKLLANPTHPERLIAHLKSQFELELEIINKIEKVEKFHDFFVALVKGEHIIRTLDEHERKLLAKMQERFNKIFSNEISEGITYEWAMTVFEAIEDKVHEGVANDMFPGYHPDIDFQFVNRPEFIELVRESIQKLRKKEVSEQMINVFVHLFREWYNHERD